MSPSTVTRFAVTSSSHRTGRKRSAGTMLQQSIASRTTSVLAHALATLCLVFLLAGLGSAQPPTPPSPRGTAAGRYLPLPDRRLISQRLPPQLRQIYTFTTPPGGNVSITVFPCQGHVSWNITYVGARIFSHPRYPTGKRRKKRCCVTAGVTHNFNFGIAGLNAGLGTSMGDGAITYFLEDTSGGTYYLSLTNNSPTLARYEMFATLRPAISPYVQLPNDPQAKVTAIRDTELDLSWMPVRGEPWGGADVDYCVEYHRTSDRTADDVRSSTCAAHRTRQAAPSSGKGCVSGTSHTLADLAPGTQYSIDVFARNLRKRTETAYLSVTASTAGESVALSNVTQRRDTLLPLETRVYTMTPSQRSTMLAGVSPCSGNVKWSVLNAAGRSIQDYRQLQGSPGVQRYDALSNGRGAALPVAERPRVFVNNLPSVDRQFASHFDRGARFSIAVSNLDARRPSSFELYTAVNGHMAGYPRLPVDRQLTLGLVTASSISVKWHPVLSGLNVTYCVHVFPHNKAVRDQVVHSSCGLSSAQQRSAITAGQCSAHIYRTVNGLQRDTWYDVDVVAKNMFTRRHHAYAGLLVFTGGSPGAHIVDQSRPLMYYSSAKRSAVVNWLSMAAVLVMLFTCAVRV